MTIATSSTSASSAAESALLEGARVGDCIAIETFLATGATLQSTRESALLEAVRYDRGSFVSELLLTDPNCDRPDWLGFTAFDHALRSGQLDIVDRFLSLPHRHRLLHPKTDVIDMLPLHAAAGGHAEATVKRILDAGVAPDERDKHGKTALMVAAGRWRDVGAGPVAKATVIDILLAFGADVNAQDARGRSSLYFACIADDGDAVLQLAKNGARLDCIAEGTTPVFAAIASGASHALQALHSLGVDAGRSPTGETPITQYLKHTRAYAGEDSAWPTLSFLLEHGYRPEEANAIGERPIELAAPHPADLATIAAAIARKAVRAVLH